MEFLLNVQNVNTALSQTRFLPKKWIFIHGAMLVVRDVLLVQVSYVGDIAFYILFLKHLKPN